MKLKPFFPIFTAVCLFVLISGCGGKKSSSKLQAMPEQHQQVSEPEAVPEAPKPEKKKKKKKKAKVQEVQAEEEELPEELRVEEMTLPVSASQWTEREITYIRAAQKDLFDSAITELTTRLNNPETADSSASLLLQFAHSVIPVALAQEEKLRANEEKLKSEGENEEKGKSKNQALATPIDLKFYQLSPQQIRTIFSALGASTCETAKKGMAAFLAGTIATDDNKSALESLMVAYAVKAQDDKISKEEEDLLLAFLLTPEKAVRLAAEYAEVEAPEIAEVELDQNGNPIQKNKELMSTRGNHSPIAISPEKRVQFKFEGGNGTLNAFTHLDVQKLVLTKFCPASSPLFRAQIARGISSQEVAAAADTQAKQTFLRDEVLDKFLLQRNFANVIAHILISKQPDLDEKWQAATAENLFSSCQYLMQNHFGFIDAKSLEEYQSALQEREARKRNEKEKERKAVKSAEAPASTAQVPVSLLSRQANAGKMAANPSNPNQVAVVRHSPLVELMLNPQECEALEKEVWTAETRELLRSRIQESLGVVVEEALANMPELGSDVKTQVRIPNFEKNALQSIQMYLLIPCVETRAEIYNLLDKAWILGPEPFRQTLFDRLETEPGFLMAVKSLDRRIAPKEKDKKNINVRNNKSNKKRGTKEREKSKGVLLREKKIEIGTAWMNQTYSLVCQWCGKFAQAAQTEWKLQEINRIANPKLPKPEPPKLSEELRLKFQPVNGMEVVGFYTNSDPAMPPIAESSGLKITFIELRCTAQLSKLISGYKSKTPHLLERGKLDDKKSGGNNQQVITNATWLEKFTVNEETGHQESIDILIAPPQSVMGNGNQSRGDESPRKGAEAYSVYILVMEMDDLAGEHVSKLSDEGDEEDEAEAENSEEAEAEAADEEDFDEE